MIRTRFAILTAALCFATPALAQAPDVAPPPPMPGYEGQWQGHWTGENTYQGQWNGTYNAQGPGPQGAWGGPPQGMDPRAWHDWQERAERCRDYRPSNGVGGAVVGGVVGGVIGNRVAKGDRTLGTVAGAAVGAAAGAAIDKSIDKHHREECEEFWAHAGPAMPYGGAAYAGGAYPMPNGYPAMAYPMPGGYPGYGYAPYGYVWVPVMIPGQQKPCVETVTTTTEYVPVTTRSRVIRRRPVVRDKRVREKRVYTGS